MDQERTPVVPANRLLEVAGVLSDGAARLHEQLGDLPPAERQALLEVVVSQVGDIVQAWSELVRAVVSVNGSAPPAARARRERPVDVPETELPPPPPEEPARQSRRAPRLRQVSAEDDAPAPAPRDSDDGSGLSRDELTGVLNRQAGHTAMTREVERCRRQGLHMVIGYLNVDGMREVNDSNGPRAGDELLRKVAAALRATLRSYDVVFRLAGDEFIFSLPGADLTTAEKRLREFNVILAEEAPGASVSVGFAELGDSDSLDELVSRADDALVHARRRRGRPRLR